MKLTRFVPLALVLAPLAARAQAQRELPPPQTIVLFGQRIEYYDVGTGPAVVLLHGLGSSAKREWGRCILPLAEHHRVLAPDQLGFGASDKPLIDYGIQTWVDFLGEFLRAKKVGNFTLAGESLGGWIAAQYAIQSLGSAPPPGPSFALPRPARLILCDAAGHRSLAQKMVEGGGSSTSLAGAKWLQSAVFHGPAWNTDEEVRATFERTLGKGDGWTIHSVTSNRAILAEAVDDKLGGIAIPTLVVWGAEDQLIPLEDGRDFAAKIPGAKLIVIPDSGHAPCIEKADLFLAAIRPFVDGTP
jgi:pimeloyl-ACP methyl ester carboxylesterase